MQSEKLRRSVYPVVRSLIGFIANQIYRCCSCFSWLGNYDSSSSSSAVGYTNVERPVKIDLPRDRAFWASTTALCLQVARRLSRFDLEVFFLGTAMSADIAILDNLLILGHPLTPRTIGKLNWEVETEVGHKDTGTEGILRLTSSLSLCLAQPVIFGLTHR